MIALALVLALQGSQDVEFRTLLDQLRSDDIDRRDSARDKLIKGGARTLDAIGRTTLPKDAEEAAQLREVARQVVEYCVRAEWNERMAAPVTLDLKDAPVSNVVEVLRKQTSFKIDYDDSNVPDSQRIDQIRLTRVPFSKALGALLEGAEMEVVGRGNTLLRIARPARLTFQFRQVELSVVFDMVWRLSNTKIRADAEVKGRIDYSCDNVSWTKVLDDVAARTGCVVVRSPDKEVVVRPKAGFEKELKTRTFELQHLRPESPEKGRTSRFSALVWAVEGSLSRGAGWDVVHGKVSYDPWAKAIVVTDREIVLGAAAKLIAEHDRE